MLLEDRLDLVNMQATLLGTDGIGGRAGWHPVSGKLSYLRVGRSEIRAEYDAQGVNLLKISNSAGQWLGLAYDGQGPDPQPQDPGGRAPAVRLQRPGASLPTSSSKGEGCWMCVTSRASAGGQSETPQMALKIAQTFQQLLQPGQGLGAGAEAWPGPAAG